MTTSMHNLTPKDVCEIKHEMEDRIQATASKLVVTDEKLQLDGTILCYKSIVEGKEHISETNLDDIWLPGVAGWEHPVPLLIYPHLAETLITSLDDFASRCEHTVRFPKTTGPSYATYIGRFIEWNLLNGRYRLEHIQKKQIKDLGKQLQKGGMTHAIRLKDRLNQFLKYLDSSPEILSSFLTFSGSVDKQNKVQGVSSSLLSRCIGSYSLDNMIPNEFYQKIASRIISAGYRLEDNFLDKGTIEYQQPAAKTLMHYFSCWNDLALMDDVDHLTFLPYPNIQAEAGKLGLPPSRTANIHVDDVVSLLGNAHHWLFNVAPVLIKLIKALRKLKNKSPAKGPYKGGKANERTIRELWIPRFLKSSKIVDELESVAGIKLYRAGSANQTTNAKDENVWSVVDCISALMTACYLVLQIYNARRQAEIQDPIVGIKRQYFRCKSKRHNWYQAFFFNEKHNERLWYTLNKGSTKAIQVLIKLSNAWDEHGYDGLFNVPSFALDDNHHFKCFIYNYNKGGHCRITGDKFLRLSLGREPTDLTESHIYRRIYAIIYHYQYDNAVLLALCHQLGHIDPDDTMVYVTEPISRDLHEQLHHKVKLSKNEEREKTYAIKEENRALQKIIDEVDVEKTAEDILDLMLGNTNMGGKYTHYLRRIYRILDNSVTFSDDKNRKINFSDLPPETQSKKMAQVMFGKGHRNRPKPHSSCHRIPNTKRNHDGPCEPESCKRCAYQEVKDIHLSIMQQDLIDLKVIQDDFTQPFTERIKAEQASKNLEYLISHHKNTMSRNQQLFSKR
ncbi:MAG: hypothetical protein WBF78_06510 [Vibrio anguillarum]